MKRTNRLLLALLALSILGAAPVWAGTANATLAVNAIVVPSCTITTTSLSFGSFGVISGTPQVDGSASVIVACSSGSTYSIALDKGVNSTAGASPFRRMTFGSPATSSISYEIYSDAGRTTIWGDGTFAPVVNGTGTGANQNYTTFGRIPAGQTVGVGNHTDAVTATVLF